MVVVKHQIEAGKDTFYRLKNNPGISWRMVLWLFATKFKSLTDKSLIKALGRLKCMIFDDTLIEKTGKHIEKVSRVWDHVSQKAVLGFKLLLMGYWDGTSLVPLDFSCTVNWGKTRKNPLG